jgi:GntR family transcriptional repressor for pyruvate dehydrogenase complex
MMESAFTSVSITRSYEQIVHQIHEAIRNGALTRGAKLPTERELSDTFGVSRSVVREAVKVLVAQGIVESRQGSGTFVLDSPAPFVSRTIMLDVPVEESAIEQLIEFREALDTLAAGRAALRRTDDEANAIMQAAIESQVAAQEDSLEDFGDADIRFHTLIDHAANNIYVAIASSTVRQAQSEMTRVFASDIGNMLHASDQHIEIARAIHAQQSDLAVQAMGAHVRYSGSTTLKIPKEVRTSRSSRGT